MSIETNGENAPGNRRSLPDFRAARKSARFWAKDFCGNSILENSKFQVPNPKEIPSAQAPNCETPAAENWTWRFGASLEIGTWKLVLHSGSSKKCHVYRAWRKLIVRGAK